MTTNEVDALVRDVIVHFGSRFTVVSVISSPNGWKVSLGVSGSARVVSFAVGLRPAAIRAAVEEVLEAEL